MATEKIFIRVDGNSHIGLGHIYRGIALAEILQEYFLIEFITRTNSTTSPIINAGYTPSIIPGEIDLYDEPFWFQDNLKKKSIIVLDGYDFNFKYQQRLKDFEFRLVYIDDLNKGIQNADLVINHSPGISNYKTESYTKLALGLNYALIRKPFLAFDRTTIKKREKASNVLIAFGGGDHHDFTFKTAQELLKLDICDTVDVLLGAAYKNQDILKIADKRLNLHKNLSEEGVFKLMKKTDLAIVPASTTSIELASLGVPMLLGYYVLNQKMIYDGFVQQNAVIPIGDLLKFNFSNLESIILELNTGSKLNELQENLLGMFKGNICNNILTKFKLLC